MTTLPTPNSSGAAAVVINDIRSSEATDSVIADIEAAGAKAALVVGDVSERETADAMMAEISAVRIVDGVELEPNSVYMMAHSKARGATPAREPTSLSY